MGFILDIFNIFIEYRYWCKKRTSFLFKGRCPSFATSMIVWPRIRYTELTRIWVFLTRKLLLLSSRIYVPEMFIPDPGSNPGSGSAALVWIYHDCVAGAAMAARLAWSSWQEGGDAASSVLRWRGESMDTFQPRISQGDRSPGIHSPGSKSSSYGIFLKIIESPVGLLDSRVKLCLGQLL